MAISSGRLDFGRSCAVACALFVLSAPFLAAQTMQDAASQRAAWMAPAPSPADVLNPNTRRNTPYLKIAARAGLNWAAYSNERYLDNTTLDVGKTSGEQDIYTQASGFGYSAGAEVEYPINTGFSVVGSVEFARAEFGRDGPVDQECVRSDGTAGLARARHEWSAKLSYIRVGAVAKLAFPSFYIIAGLTANRLVSSRIVRTREFDDGNCTFEESGGLSRIAEDEPMVDPAGLHYSLRTGVGLVYPIADRLQFSPELTLDFGTNAINKSLESDLDFYTVSAVLRYELR